ncbi:uncharacterized protein LOC18442907 [Amborella trichopoda]|uniref:YqgF/RNase H-like domain-containing protein n=1 Tax=Amborella trichopoda TaxID=13333 RepID=U5CZT9_AMBTC|nr:uncharacterized protein LOC18442907 [Amborella trichopoda]XP_020528289.1 uncharacterized protein LOC18442907 [Amborella trichopoda]XP_020528290.1 uncharacterized protein LOC18442907 [Amborella trichopoda]XP_020528291.1 uncharacterized protein LOC18442907 [Amborella trichopoda]ERN14642.1 hypothetical protein AMTR_s00038p00196460 [Amborella trichopoda]|eukprot:XP_011626525.1 uncharacterized protein LOC18442907 [Amborella trichopoda]
MRFAKPIDLFQKLLESNKIAEQRLLGLDVGNRYVGLAISDPDNKIASPLSVLVRKKSNIVQMAMDIQTLVKEFSLIGLVVGYPLALQGTANPQAVQVKVFVEELHRTGQLDGLSYTYWDERFTSKSVEALLKPLDMHPVQFKTIVDKFAAVGILQGYLDHVHRNMKASEQESND